MQFTNSSTFNTPERQEKKQAFKTAMHEKTLARKNAPKIARTRKARVVKVAPPRTPFKGAGKK
jgi:hypothetical protein